MRRLTLLLIVMAVATAVLALFTLFTPTAQADEVGGIIDTDTTWTLAGSPYVMTDTVTILPGVTLTVEAGVTVMGHAGVWMDVQGNLQAIGTTTDPILFTSLNDSAANQWSGIYINSNGSATIERATFRYAATALAVAGSSNAPVYLTHTLFENNLYYPVSVHTASLNRLQMSNVTFSNNAFDRIFIEGNTLPNSVTLTPQPGLQGYQMDPASGFEIPNGRTLTLAAGVTLFGEDVWMTVNGHLAVNGAITATSTISGFDGIYASDSGSVTADYAHIYGGNPVTNLLGIGFGGNSSNPIQLQNTTIEATAYPILGATEALHRLQMENVTFANNGRDRVIIDMNDTNALSENTTLTDQPGLEGYEILFPNFSTFEIPAGIALTMEAGTTLMMPEDNSLNVYGHLQTEGTAVAPVTFTSAADPQPNAWAGIYILDTGSVTLQNSIIEFAGIGLDVTSNSGTLAEIQDVVFRENSIPMEISPNNLHLLQMDNVSFENNVRNRVFIHTFYNNSLVSDVTLWPHSGLEGYELGMWGDFVVPEGITLSLEAGTTILFPDSYYVRMQIQGHLQAIGTPTLPITFTSLYTSQPHPWTGVFIGSHIEPESTGSAYLEQVVFSRGAFGLSVGQTGANDEVLIQNTTFQQNLLGPNIVAESLHKVSMNNVTYLDNSYNLILIDSGPIGGDVTLAMQSGLDGYVFASSEPFEPFRVPTGYTLTLEAGISLAAGSYANHDGFLLIEGRLQAEGTAVAPITFTSSQDNAPGQWQGIVVDGGEVSLAHAEVRYAATNLTVNSPTSTVTITSSRFISASVDSIVVNDGSLYAACSVIAGSGQNGVSVAASGSPSVTITTSEIWGNGVGITNTHTLPVDARHNFWGDPSGPGGIGPGSGDTVYGNVLYEPWLAEPTCSPPPPPILPTISISDSTAVESAPFLTFTVTLNITGEQDVLVDYGTVDGTAVAGVDYQPISGTLTIPAGQVTAVLTVPLLDNDLDDGDRTFTLVPSNPVNGELGNGTAVGTILDDDTPPIPGWRIFLPLIIKP